MNIKMKGIYSSIVNIRDFQDFINLNIKCLCFGKDNDSKNSIYLFFINSLINNLLIHLFQMMINEILYYNNCEKLIRDFNCFCDEFNNYFF